jgi:predicted MFS family arabinose efflux permease
VAAAVSFIVGVAMFGAISFLPLFLQVVNGASATSSGLLLLPLMIGLLTASVVSGQIISRTGRYKAFPVAGCAVAAVALYLLSTMGTHTSQTTVTIYMVILGAGIGLTMQTLILAVQNAVDVTELGVATSSVSFFRSMGGAIGVALFGAVFNSLLAQKLGPIVKLGEGAGFSPASIQRLPAATRSLFIGGFADSLTTVFLYATPLVVLAFALTWFLREQPLRTYHRSADGMADAAAALSAEPLEHEPVAILH